MKAILTILLVIFGFNVFGQTSLNKFKCIQYDVAGNQSNISYDTMNYIRDDINTNYILKKYFSNLYLPEKLINSNYKNKTIVLWADETKEENLENNRSYTYIFDNLSRITNISYSGCSYCYFIKDKEPYSYTLKYNSLNQVELISDDGGTNISHFYYDIFGVFKQMDFYTSNGDILNYQVFLLP